MLQVTTKPMTQRYILYKKTLDIEQDYSCMEATCFTILELVCKGVIRERQRVRIADGRSYTWEWENGRDGEKESERGDIERKV